MDKELDLNFTTGQGITPLTAAVRYSNSSILELLISKGADPNYLSGRTPLITAIRFGKFPMVETLIKHGANPNAQDGSGETALGAAVLDNRADMVQYLIQAKTDVNCQDGLGQTPLAIAASQGHLDIARIMLENGADPNSRDLEGKTPLMKAVFMGKIDVVRLLLFNEGDASLEDKNGRTSCYYAEKSSNKEILDLIVQYNPDCKKSPEIQRTRLNSTCPNKETAFAMIGDWWMKNERLTFHRNHRLRDIVLLSSYPSPTFCTLRVRMESIYSIDGDAPQEMPPKVHTFKFKIQNGSWIMFE